MLFTEGPLCHWNRPPVPLPSRSDETQQVRVSLLTPLMKGLSVSWPLPPVPMENSSCFSRQEKNIDSSILCTSSRFSFSCVRVFSALVKILIIEGNLRESNVQYVSFCFCASFLFVEVSFSRLSQKSSVDADFAPQ